MLLIDKNGYYLYKPDIVFTNRLYVIFMQHNYVNHGLLNMDIAVAGCFGERLKEKQLYPCS